MDMFAPNIEDFQAYGSQDLNFRPRIDCHRIGIQPIKFTAKKVEEVVLKEWGKVNYCESLKPSTLVKPFFDFDLYVDNSPTDVAVKAKEAEVVARLQAALELESDEAIAMATSHGPVDAERFKISVRLYVQGYVVKCSDMVALLEARPELDKFDKGVVR